MYRHSFSSRNYPERDRLSALQDLYAELAKVEIEPHSEQPPFFEIVGRIFPNLDICRVNVSPHVARRENMQVRSDNRNNLAVILSQNISARFTLKRAESVNLQQGKAIVVSSESVNSVEATHPGMALAIRFSRETIETRLADSGKLMTNHVVDSARPELMLLKSYLANLLCCQDDISSELAQLASCQLLDLLVLALGAKKEEAELAQKRGLRAARLNAIKHDIRSHLTENDLTIKQVALRQRISPQYIRALFHSDQTTFRDYVNEMRLELVKQMLANPDNRHVSILNIAYSIGFNNISWFNCVFKKRFGQTPSEIKEAAILALKDKI